MFEGLKGKMSDGVDTVADKVKNMTGSDEEVTHACEDDTCSHE